MTILGFFHADIITKLFGSDIDENMVACANKNMQLLTCDGLEKRKKEIDYLYRQYQKESYKNAIESCQRLKEALTKEVQADIFRADCTKELPFIMPDIIITDVPYGNLVEWKSDGEPSVNDMLEQLAAVAHKGTILAVCTDKKQKLENSRWKRLEKQNIGKRKFEIFSMI